MLLLGMPNNTYIHYSGRFYKNQVNDHYSSLFRIGCEIL